MAKNIGAIIMTYPWEQEGFDVTKFLAQLLREVNGMDREMAHFLKDLKSIFGPDMKAIYALAWRHVIDHRPRVVNTLGQVAYEQDLNVFLTVISLSQRCKSSARRNATVSNKAKKTSSSGRFNDDELSWAATTIAQYFVRRLGLGKKIAAMQEHFRDKKRSKATTR